MVLIGLVSCVAIIGTAVKAINEGIAASCTEAAESQQAEDDRNAPREVTLGMAFTVGKHETLAGWKVEQDTIFGDAMFNVSGKVKNVGEAYTDGWIPANAQKNMEQILTKNGGKVDGVVAANDGLAGAIITVLQKNGLNGKVPVTGQDATPDGLQAILRGDQYMTVYKPIKQEADAAAKLTAALAKGDTAAADALATGSVDDTKGNRQVKSVLLTPQSITKENVKTVVDEGQVKASEICVGDLQATCQQLGINAS